MSVSRKISILSLGAAVALSLSVPPPVEAGEAFTLKGQKVTFIVPFKEGGGTDTLARLMQPFLTKYLPGNPTVVVLNQPGGGSVKAANKFQNQIKPDGRTIMGVSSSTLTPFALKSKKVKYDVLSWRPIMLIPRGSVIYANPKTTGVKGFGKDVVADIKALRKAKLKFGAKNPISSELRAFLAFELLGIKTDHIFGLSTSKQRRAFFRGELNINYDATGPYARKVKKYVKEGIVAPIMTFGYWADGRIKRDPHMPDLPTIVETYELINGKKPSGPVYEAFINFLHIGITASKSIVLPKGTPDNIRDVWVEAAKKMNADPAFLEKAAKRLGNYPRSFGDDATDVLRRATDIKPKTREWMKAWVKSMFDSTI